VNIGGWGALMIDKKVLKIGLIVENQSDFDTITELSKKIPIKRKITFKKALGKGCGKVRLKCKRFAINLKNKGCHRLIIVHDLDDYNEINLKKQLQSLVKPYPQKNSVVIIPIRAIEAWLLADIKAIQTTFGYKKGKIKAINDTERIQDPKNTLTKLINEKMKKPYLNTVHNQKIAKNIDINNLLKCSSFIPLYEFLLN
jgi:hypothetical protein